MRLTKLEHACVVLEKDGGTLVIDPGAFSTPPARADAVLITHEHFDHFDPEKIPAGAEVYACPAVAEKVPGAQAVRDGDGFTAAGFSVRVSGEWHAKNHPDVPVVQNVGYLVDDELFYPGDAFTRPPFEVPSLLVPTGAPWMKLSEMIGYLRDVQPARAYSTHDALYSEVGLKLVDNWLDAESEKQKAEMRRIPPGESVDLAG